MSEVSEVSELQELKEENTGSVPCHIELFGGLRVHLGSRVVTRFRTHKTSALLAYLAYHRDRMHSREVLIELFWPEAPSLLAGRTSLSVSLSSLRHQLEPRGITPESVIRADRQSVGVAPEVTTDVSRFNELVRWGDQRTEVGERINAYQTAIDGYRNNLLPGFYDDWIPGEQEQLAERFQSVTRRVVVLYEEQGRSADAMACALRAAQAAPLSDEASRLFIRLALAAQDTVAARRQFEVLERALAEEGQVASVQTQALIAPYLALSAATREQTVREVVSVGATMAPSSPTTTMILSAGTTLPPPAPLAPPTPPVPPGIVSGVAPDDGEERESGGSGEVVATVSHIPPGDTPGGTMLPIPLTRFFGRESELTRLGWILRTPSTRLVTLTGPGGIGKTRLALQAAEETQRAFKGLVIYFVPLADVTDAISLRMRIAEALGLNQAADATANPTGALTEITNQLRQARTLLVLDNFEQIAREGASFVRSLLESVPELTCVITSRVRVPIAGEREFPVLPLPAPAPFSLPFAVPIGRAGDSAETANALHKMVQESPSVALFVDRAQLARPDFQLTSKNAAAVVELVTRLEGIPLAVELAAARALVITPQQMLSQLSRRLDMTARQEAESRHHSLRGMLRWSYDLLSERLQRFLAQLAVFRGRWDAEAAEAVTRSGSALDDIAALCDASLIRVEESGDTMRFSLLETVREFAEERLRAESEAALPVMEERHKSYFLELLEEAEGELTGADAPRWLDRLEAEYENYRHLLQRISQRVTEGMTAPNEADVVRRESEILLRLVAGLHRFWLIRGRVGEARHWLRIVQGLRAQGKRLPAFQRLTLDRTQVTRLLNGAGVLAMSAGDHPGAVALLRRCLYLRRRLGDLPGVAATLNNLAIIASERGNYAEARRRYELSLATWQKLGERQNAGRVLTNLAAIASDQGDYDSAAGLLKESLNLAREVGDRRGEAVRLRNLGELSCRLKDWDGARAHFKEALLAVLEVGDPVGVAYSILYLGIVAGNTGEPVRSARYISTALQYSVEAGVTPPAFARDEAERLRTEWSPEVTSSVATASHPDLEGLAAEICGNPPPQLAF